MFKLICEISVILNHKRHPLQSWSGLLVINILMVYIQYVALFKLQRKKKHLMYIHIYDFLVKIHFYIRKSKSVFLRGFISAKYCNYSQIRLLELDIFISFGVSWVYTWYFYSDVRMWVCMCVCACDWTR